MPIIDLVMLITLVVVGYLTLMFTLQYGLLIAIILAIRLTQGVTTVILFAVLYRRNQKKRESYFYLVFPYSKEQRHNPF